MRIIATECLARRSTEGRSAGGVRPRNHPLTNEYTPRGAAEDPRFVYVALAASCIRIHQYSSTRPFFGKLPGTWQISPQYELNLKLPFFLSVDNLRHPRYLFQCPGYGWGMLEKKIYTYRNLLDCSLILYPLDIQKEPADVSDLILVSRFDRMF